MGPVSDGNNAIGPGIKWILISWQELRVPASRNFDCCSRCLDSPVPDASCGRHNEASLQWFRKQSAAGDRMARALPRSPCRYMYYITMARKRFQALTTERRMLFALGPLSRCSRSYPAPDSTVPTFQSFSTRHKRVLVSLASFLAATTPDHPTHDDWHSAPHVKEGRNSDAASFQPSRH